LEPKAPLLFVDQLSYDGFMRTQDSDGNILEQRLLPDSSRFTIVKNFPTKRDITDYLKDIAYVIRYIDYPKEWWSVLYKKKKQPGEYSIRLLRQCVPVHFSPTCPPEIYT
jgi:hypothetical protein